MKIDDRRKILFKGSPHVNNESCHYLTSILLGSNNRQS